MKKAAFGILVLVLSGCATAPLSTSSASTAQVAPVEQVRQVNAVSFTDEDAPIGALEVDKALPPPVGGKQAVESIAPSNKHISKNDMNMRDRVALANQIMVQEARSSGQTPIVCDTTARRTPAGQLIYESSCH